MADPTNARQRTLNSFFDAPRFTLKALPELPEDPVTPPAAAPAATAVAPPAAAAVAPRLTLALQPASKRTRKAFLDDGLLVKVASDVPLADVELRLFEVLEGGALRPLGSAFRSEPLRSGVSLRIEPTRFARSRLGRGKGARRLLLQASGVARNGVTGTARSTFGLR